MPRRKKKQRTRKTVTNTNVVNVSNRIVLGARYIRSRRRPNLRELRQAMPPDPRAFHNPAYYGNVAMLTNSALSQFQNQRYSMERELREMKAEGRAAADVGKRVEGHDEQITQMQRRYDVLVEAHGRLAEGARGGRGAVGASVFASPSGSFAESPRGASVSRFDTRP